MFIFLLLFTGCTQNKQNFNSNSNFNFFKTNQYHDNLNDAINDISKQLFLNIPKNTIKYNKIALTTFVNLDNLKETSSFGRVISESLINELATKNFNVIDFRQQNVISVNSQGEFLLTRDTEKLIDEIPGALILVGTYSVLEKDLIVINARIINNETLDIVSTARIIIQNYQTCKKFNLCTVIEKETCLTKEGLLCKKDMTPEIISPLKNDCTGYNCNSNTSRNIK